MQSAPDALRKIAICSAALIALLAATNGRAASPASAPRAVSMPAIRHVFVLVLENQSFERTFSRHSPAPYLARELPAQGAWLLNYYAIGHNSLGNYVAMISGQAPNEQTQGDCVTFSDFRPSRAALDPRGQLLGVGCVYPQFVKTLPDQLDGAGFTWKGYMEDMGKDPRREAATCAHSALGARDKLLEATPADQYAVKHNPFVYFHSIIDTPARCDTHVVNLERLTQDLRQSSSTPNFVFITPNLCHDGHDGPCIDGEAGGLTSIDAFLRLWIPRITQSEAFRKDGLLVVTFDESDAGSEACCGEVGLTGPRFPPGLNGPGGGRIGAVLLSPFIRAGTRTEIPYNHYSLLRSVEDIFGLPHLGLAADPSLEPFGHDIFNEGSDSH